ncbi:hypothetical protein TWF481_010150 [Arthrobotrys musiformis]
MESSPVLQATQTEDEEVKTSTVILATEEELEGAKESLKEITSIHIYSVEPGPIKDLLAVSDASTELYSRFPTLDAAKKSKIYGTTLNKYVKKRDGAPPPPPPPQPTKSSTYVVPVKKEPLVSTTPVATPTTASKDTKKDVKKDFFGSIKAKDAQKQGHAPESTSSSKAKIPLKRGQSDLMSSFSNAQPKKPKQPAKEKTPPPPSDFMDVDDDDELAEAEPIDEETRAADRARQEELRKKREEEEEELRRMMDEEDDEPIVTEPKKPVVESVESPEEAMASPVEESPAPAPSASAPGRRKVKRKVTKKVRSKDESGYIVTREVTEWEEYSEDDIPAPAKPAAKPNAFSAMKQASSSQKGKKAAGEGGPKRDIASFFQRK